MSRFDALNEELENLKVLVHDKNKAGTLPTDTSNENPNYDEVPNHDNVLDESSTKSVEQSFASIEEFMEDVSQDQQPLNCHVQTIQL